MRVEGVNYASATEARDEAERLEQMREDEVSSLREQGREGEADRRDDAYGARIRRLQAAARQMEGKEARSSSQPAGRPARKASSKRGQGPTGATRTRTGGARDGRSISRRSSRAFGGSSGGLLRHGYRRSGAQAAVTRVTGFGWLFAGLTVGMALLVLFLRPRGPQAFADLASIGAGALSIVVEPIDPLEPKLLDKIAAQAKPAPAAKPVSPTSPAGLYGTSLVAARRPANRRPARRTVMA